MLSLRLKSMTPDGVTLCLGHQTGARGFFVENYDHHSRLAVPPDFFPPLHFPVDLPHFEQALTHLL